MSRNIITKTKRAAKEPDATSGAIMPCTTTYIRIVFSNIKYWFWRRSLCKQLMFISLKTSARDRSHFCLDNNWFFIYSLSVAAARQRQIASGTFSHGTRISSTTVHVRYCFLAKSSRREQSVRARLRLCSSLVTLAGRAQPLVCHTSDQIHEIKLKLMYTLLKAFHNHRSGQ